MKALLVESRGVVVVDPSSSLVVPTFVRNCETLAVVAVVLHCTDSHCRAVGSQVAVIVAALAFPACTASENTLRTGSAWACQSCDRKVGLDSLGSSVYLLVFQSCHFQARDLFLEPQGGMVGALEKGVRRKSGQVVEGPARSALGT